MHDLKHELLPTRWRVPKIDGTRQQLDCYPNTMTLESVLAAMEDRISRGIPPLEAFLTVADGVRNWSSREE